MAKFNPKFNHVDSIIKIACCLNHIMEAYKYQNDLAGFKSTVTSELAKLSYNKVVTNENDYITGCLNAFNTILNDYGKDEFSNTLKDAWNSIMAIIEPHGKFNMNTKEGWLTIQMMMFPYFDAFCSIIK